MHTNTAFSSVMPTAEKYLATLLLMYLLLTFDNDVGINTVFHIHHSSTLNTVSENTLQFYSS